MASVYCVGGLHETTYFNTFRDADRCKPGGEEPESVERLDAADECNQLERQVEEAERFGNEARMLLEELWGICGTAEVIAYAAISSRVAEFLEAHPLPAVTCADRDGGRSYGV